MKHLGKFLVSIAFFLGLPSIAQAQNTAPQYGPGPVPCAYTTCQVNSLGAGTAAPSAAGSIAANLSFNIVNGGGSYQLQNGSTLLSSPTAAQFQFGAADVAGSPVAQTLSTQSAAGVSNTAGANTTIDLSAGTGTGTGGNLVISGAPHSTTGSTKNAYSAALTINGDTLSSTFGGSVSSTQLTLVQNVLLLQGNQTTTAWTTTGTAFKQSAATFTDSSSTGTVPAIYINALQSPTLAFSNAGVTVTNAYNTYFKSPIAGTNATIPNAWALGADNLNILGLSAASSFQASAGGQYNWNGRVIITSPLDAEFKITNNAGSTTLFDYGVAAAGTLTINGALTTSANVNVGANNGLTFIGRTILSAPADGQFKATTNAGSTTLWDFGVTTAAVLTVTGGLKSTTAALNFPGLGTSSAGTTGTLCWTTSTGLVNVDTTTTCLLSLEELKDIRGPISGAEALSDVLALKPFWGTWKKSTPEYAGDKAEQPFLGAHQVASVDKRLAAYAPNGALHGVRYQELTAVLVGAIKAQQDEINQLKREISRLEPRK